MRRRFSLKLLLPLLLLLATLGGLSRAECSEGTLICDLSQDTPAPTLCDYKNDFVLNAPLKTCEKMTIEGCATPAFSSSHPSCFKCESGKVFDAEANKCTDIIEENKILNCVSYNSDSFLCEKCEENFLLTNNVCQAIPEANLIENCAEYSTETDCLTCKSAHFLKENKCVSFEQKVGCKFHTDFECGECLDSHFLTPDYSPPVAITDVLKLEILNDRLIDGWWTTNSLNIPVCLEKNVPNCLEFESATTCKKCENGHYLDDNKQCPKNPEALFPHCLRYKDKENCNQCGGPFYLNKEKTECLKAKVVENCLEYEIMEDKCAFCLKEYWLDRSVQECKPRTLVNIDFCLNISLFSDECLACETDMSLTSDKLKCLPDIKNCLNQEPGENRNSEKHSCLMCQPPYYLKQDVCVEQNVKNCQKHVLNQNKCQICDDKYYVKDGECELQNIDHCSIYYPNENKCKTCEGSRYLFDSKCQLTYNPNCEVFKANSNECFICEYGYYLRLNKCYKNQRTNCQTYETNENKCKKCVFGFFNEDGVCVLKFIDHCADYNSDTNVCSKCSAGYYLEQNQCKRLSVDNCVEYEGETSQCKTCAANMYLEGNECKIPNIPFCIQYDKTTCLKCQKGTIQVGNTCQELNEDHCIEYVGETSVCNACIKGYYLNLEKKCIEQKVDHCIQYNEGEETCNTCALGYWNETSTKCTPLPKNIDNCIGFDLTTGKCNKCSAGQWLDGDVCRPGEIDNCIKISNGDRGCEECAAGFAVSLDKQTCLKQETQQCARFKENSQDCEECIQWYRLRDDKQCSLLSLPFCIQYNEDGTCKICQEGKLVKDGRCVTYDVKNCIEYEENSTDCKTCAQGYWKFDGNNCVKQNIENCIEYKADSGDCKNCSFGFMNKTTSCEPFDTSTCLKFDDKAVCIECPKDKYMDTNDNNTCKTRKNIHCIEYEGTTNDCKICQDGFYKDENNSCQRQNIPNCIDYDPNVNTCIKCRAGTIKKHNSCLQNTVNNCIEPDTNVVDCKTCALGTFLKSVSECDTNTQDGCNVYNENANTCKECDPAFSNQSGTCVLNDVDNCLIYNNENGECTRCNKEYHLVDGNTCTHKNLNMCIEYTSDQVCNKCALGYYFDTNTSQCTTNNIPNCVEFNQQTKTCDLCEKGRYAASGGTTCEKVSVDHCIDFKPNENKCKFCGINTYPINDGDECAPVDHAHCIEFVPNTNTCEVCGLGYYSDSNKACVKQDLPLCLDFNLNLNTCKFCPVNYYPDDNGICILQETVQNCREYHLNSPNCEICDKGYYLKSATECAPQLLDLCIEYQDNANICTKCQFMYHMENNVCILQTAIDYCVGYNTDYTQCISCIPGWVPESGACKVATKTNCLIFKQNLDECDECEMRYTADQTGTCIPLVIEHCHLIDPFRKGCKECDPGYYSNDDGMTCITPRPTVDYCVEYNDNDTRNITCRKCQSMKYLKDGECVDVDVDPNCYSSAGYSNVCTYCKAGYYMKIEGDFFNQTRTCTPKSPENLVDNCLYVTSNEDSWTCGGCQPGFTLLEEPKKVITRIPNCYKMHADKKTCQMCDEYYALVNETTCEGPKTLPLEIACIQKQDDYIGNLDDNENCETCDHKNKNHLYYHDIETDSSNKKCVERDLLSQYDQFCKIWDYNKNGCLECYEEGFVRKYYGGYHTILGESDDPKIPECEFYTANMSCKRCGPGFNMDKGKCYKEEKNQIAIVNRSFRYDFDNRVPVTGNVVTDCEAYAQINELEIGCTKCRLSYVGIVPDPTSIGLKRFAYVREDRNHLELDDAINVYSHCIYDQQIDLKSDNYIDRVTPASTCAVGYKTGNDGDTGKINFTCIRCQSKMMGKLVKATHHYDQSNIGAEKISVGDCSFRRDGELSKTHRGFFFNNYKNTGIHLQRSSLMYFDTCVPGKKPVYSFITGLDDMSISYPTKTQTDGENLDVAYCVPESHLNLVEGCQIYGISEDLSENVNVKFDGPTADYTAKVKCIVCQPGYESAGDNTTCVDKRSFCNLQVSDWLGGCMTPKFAFKHDEADPFGITIADEPNQPHCKVQGVDGRCWMCQEGYQYVRWANECRLAYDPSVCSARTGGGAFIHSAYNGTQGKVDSAWVNMIWHRWEDSIEEKYKRNFNYEHCFEYNDLPVFKEGNARNFCTQRFPIIQHCKKYREMERDGGNGCLVCNDNYISFGGGCTPRSTMSLYEFCDYYKNSGDKECETCKPGYYLTSSSNKVCRWNNCMTKDPKDNDICLICPEKFYLIDYSQNVCVPETEETTCKHFSPKYQACVKCKTEGHYPFVAYHNNYSGSNGTKRSELRFECRPYDLTDPKYDRYRHEYMFFETHFSQNSSSFSEEFIVLETPEYYTLFSYEDPNYDPDDPSTKYSYYYNERNQFCAPNITSLSITDCAAYGLIHCIQCNAERYMSGTNQCVELLPSFVPKCTGMRWSYTNFICSDCIDISHYHQLVNYSNCLARSATSSGDACKQRKSTSDECSSCFEGKWKNDDMSGCVPNTASNCRRKLTNKNQCQDCATGYWLDIADNEDKTRTCRKVTPVVNCMTYSQTEDTCIACIAGFKAVEGVCEQDIYKNCLTLHHNGGTCKSCSGDFKVIGPDCKPKTATSCKTRDPDPTTDICLTCSSQYYLEDDNCLRKENTNCKTTIDDQDPTKKTRCATCSASFVIPSVGHITCVRKTISHCVEYHSTQNKCAKCSENYTIDPSSGTCTLKPPGVCLTNHSSTAVSDNTKCASCNKNFIYNSGTHACDVKTKDNCKEYDETTDTCGTCSDQFNLSSGTCTFKTATKCMSYKSDADECATCGPIDFLSGGNCELATGNDCLEFDMNNGKCGTCQIGWVKNTTNGNCEKNTAKNCKTYRTDEKKCASCWPSFKWDEGEINCIKKTAKNCKTFVDDPNKDECDECAEFFAVDKSTGNCEPNIATDCLTFSDSSNTCSSCSRLFLKDEKTGYCVLKDALNCETFATGNKNECETCKVGFVKNPATKICDQNSASSCRTYDPNDHKCATCSELFVKSDQGTCESELSPNCLTFNTDSPGCATCFEANFVKNNNTCQPKDKMNCLKFEDTENKCKTCTPNFYLDSEFNCKEREAENCDEFLETNIDGCKTCLIGYYLEDNKCKKNNGKDCLTYNLNADGCATCGPLFWKDGNNCERHDSTLCKTFKEDESKCLTCGTSYFKSANEKTCQTYEADYCLEISDSSNECSKCSGLFKLNSGKCEWNSGKNCEIFKELESGCEKCMNGFYLNEDECLPVDRENCKAYATNKNECSSCGFKYYLDASSKHCKVNQGQKCHELDESENGCLSCFNGFYKSSIHCEMKTEAHCKAFTSVYTEKKCNDCGELSVLSQSFKCDKNKALNCKTYDSSDHKCQECTAWHHKNTDGDCVRVTAQFCQEVEEGINQCKKCVRGWVFDEQTKTCEPNKGKNCLEFKIDVDGCESCKDNSWPDEKDGNQCKDYTAENCVSFKEDKDECLNCKEKFYLRNEDGKDLCVENTAEHCDQWSKTENKCLSCVAGYYIDSNKDGQCVASTAENCETYNRNENKCASCQEGYLTIIEDNSVRCERYTATDCKSFKKYVDTCISCKDGYFEVVSQSDGKVTCTPRSKLNCVDFLPDQDGCSKCPDTHHIDVNSACIELSQVKFCEKYYLDKNECMECQIGYYRSPDKNECIENPSGISNCIEYLNSKTCWKCDDTSYISTFLNLCLPVLVKTEHCAEYLNATLCKQCKENYYLTNGECLEITVQNCKELQTHERCIKCDDNFIIDIEKGICNPSNIENCMIADLNPTGVVCSQCLPGYLLSEDLKSCNQPNPLIENCEDYKDNETCQKCVADFLLSKDSKSCVKNQVMTGSQCSRGKELESPRCDKCHYGFSRDIDGKCNLLTPSKCAVVDSKTEKCLMCAPGTYMDNNETCIGTPSDLELVPDEIRGNISIFEWFRISLVLLILFKLA